MNYYNLPTFDIQNPKKIFEDITTNPKLLSYFYMYLFNNSKYLNFSLFSKNIKSLSQKILSFSPQKNYDMYISLSCIFGAFLGDSLGGHCEFMGSSPTNHMRIYGNDRFSNGQITDDSELAISKAFAIMDMSDVNKIDQNLLFYYYGVWTCSNPYDQGMTTSTALHNFRIESMPINDINLFSNEIRQKVKIQNCNSKANGGLMRISTLIVWFYYKHKNEIRNCLNSNDQNRFLNLYLSLFEEVKKDFEITHPNRENIVAGALVAFMTLCTMNQFSGKDTINKLMLLLKNDLFNNHYSKEEKTLNSLIKKTLKEISYPNFQRFEYFKTVVNNMGLYIHAFNLILYYLSVIDERRMNEENIYIKIIQEICDYGGDTDTNAAIVGTVIGPLIGYLNFTRDKDRDKLLFENLLNFYDKNRILYTSSFMLFFVEYLDKSFNKINSIYTNDLYNGNNYEIKYNVLALLLNMFNKNI